MRRLFLVFLISLFFIITPSIFGVYAQDNSISGLVTNIQISESESQPGDILSNNGDGIFRTSKAYDSQMIGVIVESPVISVGDKTDTSVALLSSGRALVRVSASGGEIKAGDFLTSSDVPGVAQKASSAGYVLGKAMEGYSDTSTTGRITVLVDIGYFSQNPNVAGLLGSILAALNIGFSNSQNFPIIIRYIMAAVVGVATFGFSSVSFLRFMRNGIEAIGRNPLARKTIISGMILNGLVVGLITAAGFGIAIAIVLF